MRQINQLPPDFNSEPDLFGETPPARAWQDRAAVVADVIIQLIFARPRNLRLQLEVLLRDEFLDVQQETINDIRTPCE